MSCLVFLWCWAMLLVKSFLQEPTLSQSPSHIRYIRSSTPAVKDFSLLLRAKFTGGFFLLEHDSCLIVRCPMRSGHVLNQEHGDATRCRS